MTDNDKQSANRIHPLLMLVALLLPTLITWVYFSLLSQYPAWQQKLAYSVGKTIQFALPVIILLYYGRWIKQKTPHLKASLRYGLTTGLIIGIAIYCLYRFAFVPTGIMEGPKVQVQAKLNEMQINSLVAFATLGIGYAIVHSLLEEYYWRWFIFGNLNTMMSLKSAIAVSSLVSLFITYWFWPGTLAGIALGRIFAHWESQLAERYGLRFIIERQRWLDLGSAMDLWMRLSSLLVMSLHSPQLDAVNNRCFSAVTDLSLNRSYRH